MSVLTGLRPGARVRVLWGLDEPRMATVLEVWGELSAPTQVRVELDARTAEGDSAILLLSPNALVAA